MAHSHPLRLPRFKVSSVITWTPLPSSLPLRLSSSSPDFDDPYTQNLLRHVRHLHVRSRLIDWHFPTIGFSRLTSLTISIVEDGYNGNMWASLIEIVQNLTNQIVNPLSSIELHIQAGPVELWTALSNCLLKSLTLKDILSTYSCFQRSGRSAPQSSRFIFAIQEHGQTATPAEIKFRKRFFCLKHLIMEGTSALLWRRMSGRSALPWIRAPNLETVSLTGYEALHKSELENWVLDIDFAKQAADSGYDIEYEYYNAYEAPDNKGDGLDEDQEDLEIEQYSGVIPGAKIHSYECRYPPQDYGGTMSVVIENMDSVQKMAVNRLKNAPRGLHSLTAHLETLVELDLWQCYLPSTTVVRFLEECLRLQAFVGDALMSDVVRKSRPWACVGMKKVKIEI
ncbi:hypothetical protein BGZ82_011476 [Podila clonocystis]|nr:hypothetical protein BGZ82_011476 [Podila clonocystis]